MLVKDNDKDVITKVAIQIRLKLLAYADRCGRAISL